MLLLAFLFVIPTHMIDTSDLGPEWWWDCPTCSTSDVYGDVNQRREPMMKVNFVERENGPERLACEAEVLFGEGPFAGMKLVGFSLWKSPEGEVYVTFPSRAFGGGSERRFFDYLRSIEGSADDTKRVKAWILDEYHRQEGSAADPEPADVR